MLHCTAHAHVLGGGVSYMLRSCSVRSISSVAPCPKLSSTLSCVSCKRTCSRRAAVLGSGGWAVGMDQHKSGTAGVCERNWFTMKPSRARLVFYKSSACGNGGRARQCRRVQPADEQGYTHARVHSCRNRCHHRLDASSSIACACGLPSGSNSSGWGIGSGRSVGA